MPKQLLESDFLTVDLSSIFKNKTSTSGSNEPATKAADSVDIQQPVLDWGDRLQSMLADNKKLSPEARETDYAIETKFFKEYFTANWSSCAKKLMLIGEPLRKALKVLGFDKQTNPILAFISDAFVIKLIEDDLINASTFKAIYNAVAQKLVAQSQFLESNDYNIIYCPYLYKKTADEIIEYLRLQNRILPATGSKYTKADLTLNKKIFLELGVEGKTVPEKLVRIQQTNVDSVSVKNTKLNSFELADELSSSLEDEDSTDTRSTRLDNSKQAQLVKKLNTPEKKLAAIQYISMTSDNAEARKALLSDKFRNISSEGLMKATLALSKDRANTALLTKNANDIIKLLLRDL